MPEMQSGDSTTQIGRFQVRGKIGGTRAQIYKVSDGANSRPLAMKLLTKLCADEDERARFLVEAQVMQKITHQNLVAVHEAGEDQHGQPYMVMDLVQGQTLKEGIKRESLGPLRARVLLALQLARAMEHLHFLEITHRRLH